MEHPRPRPPGARDERDERDEPGAAVPPASEGEAVGARIEVKGEATCPLCLDPLTALPQLEVCPGCRTIQHRSCVDEFGRCGTPGCRGADRAARAARVDDNQRAVATASHLLGTFGGGFLVPLLLWLLLREKQPYAAHHAWRAFLFTALSVPLTLVTLGLWVPVMIFLTVRAALRAHRGDWAPYPDWFERRVGAAPASGAPGASKADAKAADGAP